MTQRGHTYLHRACPLSGVKWTTLRQRRNDSLNSETLWGTLAPLREYHNALIGGCGCLASTCGMLAKIDGTPSYVVTAEGGPEMKIHRLDHIHVYCSDPDASLRYYIEVFEAAMLGKAHGSDGGVRHFLRLGGLTLVLAPYPRDTEPLIPAVYRDGIYENGYGIGHFGLHVDNVDEAVETVRRRGAKILAEPREFVGARFAYIGAPDGVIIELLEHRQWAAFLGSGSTA